MKEDVVKHAQILQTAIRLRDKKKALVQKKNEHPTNCYLITYPRRNAHEC